jgi:Bacterial toxin 23
VCNYLIIKALQTKPARYEAIKRQNTEGVFLLLKKQCSTNSSKTSNIVDIGFEKPRQHVWLGFWKSVGERVKATGLGFVVGGVIGGVFGGIKAQRAAKKANQTTVEDPVPTPHEPTLAAGKILGDGGDSYRTAAASIGYKDVTIGMRLGTGWRNQSPETEVPIAKQKVLCRTSVGLEVGNSEINDYRLGALYIGYKGYNVGWNNDKVRHVFQNLIAHTLIKPQAWIPSSPAQGPSLFREYRRNNPFTIW